MKVKFRHTIEEFEAGKVYDLPEKKAKIMIAMGYATKIIQVECRTS